MISTKKIGIWLPVLLAAGTLATMIVLDRRRRKEPVFDIDKVLCGPGSYLTVRGCYNCPKWMITGKSYGRAIPPSCIGKEKEIYELHFPQQYEMMMESDIINSNETV